MNKKTSVSFIVWALFFGIVNAETTILNVPNHDRLNEHIQAMWGETSVDEVLPCDSELISRERLKSVYDEDLGKPVFEISSIADDEGCNTVANRFRSELKASDLDAKQNSTTEWRFLIKIPSSFEPTTDSFTHLFQAKPEPGNPRFRLSSYHRNGGQTLELNYSSDEGGFKHLCTLGVEDDANSSRCEISEAYKNKEANELFARWLDIKVKAIWSNNGILDFELRDLETGDMIMAYHNSNIDLLSEEWETIRLKLGIYRQQKENPANISDVSVRLSDIKITREDDSAYISEELSLHLPYVSVDNKNMWTQLVYHNDTSKWVLDSYGMNSLSVENESSIVQLTSELSLDIPAIVDATYEYTANLLFSGDTQNNLWQWDLQSYAINREIDGNDE